jgi:hypothetical protein
MRVFLDSEFTSLTTKAELISLALIDEDNRSFYAEFNDYDSGTITEWHRQHVISFLEFPDLNTRFDSSDNLIKMMGNSGDIVKALEAWFLAYGRIEVWGDNHAYDWVLFCELWGGALNLPKLQSNSEQQQIDYLVRDLTTLFHLKGIDPSVSRQEFAGWKDNPEFRQHHALWDARAIKRCYEKLTAM